MSNRVIVVGGGLAGCACALALSGRDAEVTLIETSGRLGGRVNSVRHNQSGASLDNCQHSIFRIYHRFLQFIAALDARDVVKLQKNTLLPFLDVNTGIIACLKTGRFSPPNHMLESMLAFPHLGFRDKLKMRKAVKALNKLSNSKRRKLDMKPFADWLRENDQTERSISVFWDFLVLAALNLRCEEASTSQAAFLFQRGLFGEKTAFDVGSFTRDLTASIEPALRRSLAENGVEIKLNNRGKELLWSGNKCKGINTSDGDLIADHTVLCTHQHITAKMLSQDTSKRHSIEFTNKLENAEYRALIGIHAFHEGPVLPSDIPFCACIDEPVIQMLFDRTAELDPASHPEALGYWISVPISGADEYLNWDDDRFREEYERVISTAFPDAPKMIDFMVVRNKQATFASKIGSLRNRPSVTDAGGEKSGLWLGGDWCDTDWPSTMEGATRAGLSAAAKIIEHFGDSELENWHHDEPWPDWPPHPNRGDEGWSEW